MHRAYPKLDRFLQDSQERSEKKHRKATGAMRLQEVMAALREPPSSRKKDKRVSSTIMGYFHCLLLRRLTGSLH